MGCIYQRFEPITPFSISWKVHSGVLMHSKFMFLLTGCHVNGGNVVGGPTLQLGDLEKNGMLDTDALYNIIYSGKAKMPGFGSECAPKV